MPVKSDFYKPLCSESRYNSLEKEINVVFGTQMTVGTRISVIKQKLEMKSIVAQLHCEPTVRKIHRRASRSIGSFSQISIGKQKIMLQNCLVSKQLIKHKKIIQDVTT